MSSLRTFHKIRQALESELKYHTNLRRKLLNQNLAWYILHKFSKFHQPGEFELYRCMCLACRSFQCHLLCYSLHIAGMFRLVSKSESGYKHQRCKLFCHHQGAWNLHMFNMCRWSKEFELKSRNHRWHRDLIRLFRWNTSPGKNNQSKWCMCRHSYVFHFVMCRNRLRCNFWRHLKHLAWNSYHKLSMFQSKWWFVLNNRMYQKCIAYLSHLVSCILHTFGKFHQPGEFD